MKTIAPKITPFLWFNDNAGEAVKFYTSIFTNSKIHSISPMSATFSLDGVRFMALNGGPQYRFTPAISFFVGCKTRPELDALWKKLSAGGAVLMELTRYPFSERFGWLQDRFGVSWQLSLGKRAQKITPFLMFVRKQHGRAGEAIRFYASAFKDSKIINIERYGAGEVEKEGTVKPGLST
jgi:predicted 3-demethylubiquinone-9 3-methyltransferase (glyoxalase superfamily)